MIHTMHGVLLLSLLSVGVTNAETTTATTTTSPPETTLTTKTTLAATNSTTEGYELCPDFECPNSDNEGGLISPGPCSPYFCECTHGMPFLLTCDDGLVFNGSYCDWCFNNCDECKGKCSLCS